MRVANIFTSFVFVLWAALLWVGIDLCHGVVARTGVANDGQVRFYIGLPAMMLMFLIIAFILFNFVKHSPRYLTFFTGIATLLLFPFLLVYSGGI